MPMADSSHQFMPGLRIPAADLWVVAQTVWGEAEGEDFAGKLAVAQVIRNRHEIHPRWKTRSLAAICTAPWQFSCWNVGTSRRQKMLTMNLDAVAFCDSLLAATQVIGGVYYNAVGPSTHFYAVGTPEPTWAKGHVPYTTIGRHIFYVHIA